MLKSQSQVNQCPKTKICLLPCETRAQRQMRRKGGSEKSNFLAGPRSRNPTKAGNQSASFIPSPLRSFLGIGGSQEPAITPALRATDNARDCPRPQTVRDHVLCLQKVAFWPEAKGGGGG